MHDVFVLQVSGEKHWQVRPPVLESPLRDQPWTDRRDAVRVAADGPPTVDAVLAPGDCLYVPRGWLHSAEALGGTSIHLTMGVHVWTRRQLADDLLSAAGRHLDADPAVRASLELGADLLDADAVAHWHSEIRAAVDAALDAVSDAELAEALARRVRAAQRAEPLGVLAQHAASTDPATTWRPRRHLAARWEEGGDHGTAVLLTRVARVEVPSEHRDAVVEVLAGRADAGGLDGDVRRSLCLAGILVPREGSVHLAGVDLRAVGEQHRADLRRRSVGIVFQYGTLVPELTGEENVALPLLLSGTGRAEALTPAREWLERLGVAEVAQTTAARMSGGQRQRVALARALVASPHVVLADEPTGSLDSLAADLVAAELVSAARDAGAAVVMVTHDARVAAYADREVHLWDGRVDGPSTLVGDTADEVLR